MEINGTGYVPYEPYKYPNFIMFPETVLISRQSDYTKTIIINWLQNYPPVAHGWNLIKYFEDKFFVTIAIRFNPNHGL